MKIGRLLLISAMTLLLALFCSGCWALWLGGGVAAGAGAGVAATSYAKGSLRSHLDQNPVEVANATEKAFASLGVNKVSSNSSALSAEIIGRTSGDDKVKVIAETEGANGSKLSIRVGVFGDEAQSLRIFEEIKKNLPPVGK